MSQRLPTFNKKILNQKTTHHGYIFEVDLNYPEKLWESHNDYPLAPEKLKIDNTEKLVGNFYPKSRYVLHYQSWDETHRNTQRNYILSILIYLDETLHRKKYRVEKDCFKQF